MSSKEAVCTLSNTHPPTPIHSPTFHPTFYMLSLLSILRPAPQPYICYFHCMYLFDLYLLCRSICIGHCIACTEDTAKLKLPPKSNQMKTFFCLRCVCWQSFTFWTGRKTEEWTKWIGKKQLHGDTCALFEWGRSACLKYIFASHFRPNLTENRYSVLGILSRSPAILDAGVTLTHEVFLMFSFDTPGEFYMHRQVNVSLNVERNENCFWHLQLI